MEQRRKEEEQRQMEREAAYEKLIQATVPGTRYIGTISHENERQRLRLVFTEQKDLLATEHREFTIRVEASNPDNPKHKQTFTGQLIFDPKPESGGVVYPLLLSPIGDQDIDECWSFYTRGKGPLKLRLSDIGLEGEARIGWQSQQYTIRLQRESGESTADSPRQTPSATQGSSSDTTQDEDDKASAQSLLKIAKMYRGGGNLAEERDKLVELVERYPETQIAAQAKERNAQIDRQREGENKAPE